MLAPTCQPDLYRQKSRFSQARLALLPRKASRPGLGIDSAVRAIPFRVPAETGESEEMVMNDILKQVTESQLRKEPLGDFAVGDTVDVHTRIKEGDKERVQIFSGTVIRKNKTHQQVNATFTVRRIVEGQGVERIFPVHSPKVLKVEAKRKGKVRRAKRYYLRDRVGKATKVKEKLSQEGRPNRIGFEPGQRALARAVPTHGFRFCADTPWRPRSPSATYETRATAPAAARVAHRRPQLAQLGELDIVAARWRTLLVVESVIAATIPDSLRSTTPSSGGKRPPISSASITSKLSSAFRCVARRPAADPRARSVKAWR